VNQGPTVVWNHDFTISFHFLKFCFYTAWHFTSFQSLGKNPLDKCFLSSVQKHLLYLIARFFWCKHFITASSFLHSCTLVSPTLNFLAASRFPFYIAKSTTSSLNIAVYDFLRTIFFFSMDNFLTKNSHYKSLRLKEYMYFKMEAITWLFFSSIVVNRATANLTIPW
jgi:hypothetical protein